MKNFTSKFFLAILSLILLEHFTLRAQVVINEYSCSNISTLVDNHGNYEDWVELYNAGATAVNLQGYYLSDSKGNPIKWQFPNVSIAASGHLVVYCSGIDEFTPPYIHSNFKLTQTKPEEIVLMDASQVLLDSLTLNPTQKDHSRGRTTDGASTWSLFTSPTPNSTNFNYKLGYVPQPTFSLISGFYGASQNVSITDADPNASIFYTVDGSTPTQSSTPYTTAIVISQTTVLRARAFNATAGMEPSFVQSATYFINVSHSVAVVSVFGDDILTLLNGSQIDPETGLQYFDPAGQFKAFSYGETNEHGNDSWYYDQRGIDFISRDQFGYTYAVKNKLFTIKKRKEFQRIILKAAANDNYPFENGGAHIRDAYVQTLAQYGNMNLDCRTYEPCVMYANGQYWGVYDLREKVDDNDFTDYYYKQDVPYVQMLQTWGGTWSAYGGSQAQTDWNTLLNFITSNNMAVQANYDHVDSLYNIKSLLDYFILNSFVVCKDWLNWNTEWWRGLDPNGDKKKWRYCLWDEDATFGHYINYTGIPNQSMAADPCDPASLGNPGGQGHVVILNQLLQNPNFKTLYINRYVDLVNTTLNCTAMEFVLDSIIAKIAPEMPAHCTRWGGNMTTWQNNVQRLKDSIDARCIDLTQGFIDCYQVTGPYDLNIDVQPPKSGTVQLNTIHLTNFSWTGKYFGNITETLQAIPDSGFAFDHWTIDLDTLFPSTNDSIVTIDLDTNVHVVAWFHPIDTIPTPPEPLSDDVFLPTAFSPNGDGNNDVLYVLGSNIISMHLEIYNRWGMKVFESNDPSVGWDGTYKGEALNTDVFMYQFTATRSNGESVKKKGNITLMR